MSDLDFYSTSYVIANVPGMTERRLHHWRTSGAITPSIGGNHPGSGNHVRWSGRDVARLRAIAAFCEAVDTFASSASIDAIRRIWRALEWRDEVELGSGDVSVKVRIA